MVAGRLVGTLVVGSLIIACGSGHERGVAPSGSDVAAARRALDAETPKGAVRFAAAHRGPCHAAGADQVEAYSYDGPSSCLVPASLIDAGVFGCPTALALPGEDGDRLTFEYDALGRLVRADDAAFAWQGATLVGVQPAPGLALLPVRTEAARVIVDERADDGAAATAVAIDVDAAGLPQQVVRYAGGAEMSRATLTYRGQRLTAVATEVAGTAQRLDLDYCDLATR